MPSERPVEQPVRPCAWKCFNCANTSDCEGATTGDNWCNSCGACETMLPLYDQATLNAAVLAERAWFVQVLSEWDRTDDVEDVLRLRLEGPNVGGNRLAPTQEQR